MAKNQTPTMEALLAQLEAAKAENERLRREKAQSGKISCKVSEKGAVSVYGMGRFPVTLYREQWDKLFAHREVITDFMNANAKLLSSKASKEETKEAGRRIDMATGKEEVPFA